MPTADQLRPLGPEGLTALLELRPEVLAGPPPRSLIEIAARLDHPMLLSQVLARLPLPPLQVGEALAALGDRADRSALEQLLGVEGAALEGPLEALRERFLLIPGQCRLDPALEAGWPRPLALRVRLADYLPGLTVEQVRAVLRSWNDNVILTGLRKADLVGRLTRLVNDADRVRAMVESVPEPLAEQLARAAYGAALYHYASYRSYRKPGATDVLDSLDAATDRLLLVRTPYDGGLEMPAEIALALRGEHWRAPFDPQPPVLHRQAADPDTTDRAAVAAGGAAVRLVGTVLRSISAKPPALIKDGRVGVREVRRLAKEAGTPPEQVRLSLALSDHLELITRTADTLVVAAAGRAWLNETPGRALASLLTGWMTLPDIPMHSDDLAWGPIISPPAMLARRAVLEVLGEGAGAPTQPDEVARAAFWRAPLALGGRLGGNGVPHRDDDFTDDDLTDYPATTTQAVLAEAEVLGVTGAGALSSAGRAALAGDDVESALGSAIGQLQDRAVLQADLTATVLGHPADQLVTLLNLTADQEARSAANVWRFSAASIRRALDTGRRADELLADLAAVSTTDVPQTLAYLVTDTGRQHGRLRAGEASSYLVSDDAALLAEVAADRKLKRLDLRPVAPTVLISAATPAQLIGALRSAGHGVVAVQPDGTPILTRAPGTDPTPPPATTHRPAGQPSATFQSRATTKALVAELFRASDVGKRLLDTGQTIIDVDSITEMHHGFPAELYDELYDDETTWP